MVRGRDKQQWNHTAQLLAMMANAWLRQKGQPPIRMEQFHPYLRGRGGRGSRGIPLKKSNLHLLAIAMGAVGAPKV